MNVFSFIYFFKRLPYGSHLLLIHMWRVVEDRNFNMMLFMSIAIIVLQKNRRLFAMDPIVLFPDLKCFKIKPVHTNNKFTQSN
jgi:hypothetical protein